MSRKSVPSAPEVEGLFASRPVAATWLSRPGRSFAYHVPADCRPLGRRVHVHLWDEGEGSHVAAIEGNGRGADFRTLGRVELAAGAGDAEVADAVRMLAGRHLSFTRPASPDPDRVAAGILTRAGFREDDFLGGTAWLRPAEAGFSRV